MATPTCSSSLPRQSAIFHALILGLYGDNGKGNGNYYNGLYSNILAGFKPTKAGADIREGLRFEV